jgi:hypothetical protein
VYLDKARCAAVNELFGTLFSLRQGRGMPPLFASLSGARVEAQLRENLRFRAYLRQTVFRDGPVHLFADRRTTLGRKLSQPAASLEGNTKDALISGRAADGRQQYVFIEAKFAWDISKDISYLPVRNQLARNIDCAMDLLTEGGKRLDGLGDMWFVLLTPGVFRIAEFGGAADGPSAGLRPDRSWLYCYKMADYLDPARLREDLPHWADVLSENQWRLVVSHLGWLTFEEMGGAALRHDTIGGSRAQALRGFFTERGMVV